MKQSKPSDRSIATLAQALLQFAASAGLPDSITLSEVIARTGQTVPTLSSIGRNGLDRLNEGLTVHQVVVGWSLGEPARDGRFYLRPTGPRSDWPVSISGMHTERLQREKSRAPCKIGTQPALVWLLKGDEPTVGQRVGFVRTEGGKWDEGMVTKINPDGHFFIDLI